ncbi:uncharacterized protein Z518_09651 [Rhinocladiella mackenziei CBS 650.93]|uniref:Rhinocladiella mackenziei CBS 650.93 unplaced genomic scaffold supercont1.8, whole genome shotgun sequence n=1 Tax=Rhinocladiella mackenziei CBS 650.93 TaxID=1442369 RepID=A0A0D2IBB8_9EURO|nr:uncharacterized protein Z518_09651 [Rhinocladiella mackenziei CBS 650.93]KIX00586.1 hypothetical protein Z518_09651 [Rhinocladiella mackenziei CBS 650.93]
MASMYRLPVEVDSEPVADGNFHFISIRNPEEGKDRRTRRRARSYAVKQALENKRKSQKESMNHFQVSSSEDYARRFASRSTRTQTLVSLPYSLSVGTLDPFQTLAVDSSRLQALLGNDKARQASEPVFSVANELAYHSFHAVFQSGLDDPALVNAVMLTFAFAATEGIIDRECLGYQSQAMGCISERMSSLDRATSAPTMGAILLLAGVEARLGMQSHVQLHMIAIRRLLDICRTEGIYIAGGIKRAIFWQDLNSSVMTGSRRVVSHTTFAELQWRRDPFSPSFFRLPPGFRALSHLLTNDFIEVLEDIHALQCIRECAHFAGRDVLSMAYINNHQASIQSRLVDLVGLSSVLECCRLAAYLCSSMLCCKVWCALVIPSHISLQLLRKLQQASDDLLWNDHPDLLLWLLYIGGSFAPKGVIRSDYVELLRRNHAWLKHFYDAFLLHAKVFWEETLI